MGKAHQRLRRLQSLDARSPSAWHNIRSGWGRCSLSRRSCNNAPHSSKLTVPFELEDGFSFSQIFATRLTEGLKYVEVCSRIRFAFSEILYREVIDITDVLHDLVRL